MESNETQEETKIEPPSYFTSEIRYAGEHVERSRKEAIRMEKELRATKTRAAAADANYEVAKLHLEEARERLETWIEHNKPKPVEKAADETEAEAEEPEPESTPEPESVRTLAGVELGNGLDTGFTDEGIEF